jgi:hypothetical protein
LSRLYRELGQISAINLEIDQYGLYSFFSLSHPEIAYPYSPDIIPHFGIKPGFSTCLIFTSHIHQALSIICIKPTYLQLQIKTPQEKSHFSTLQLFHSASIGNEYHEYYRKLRRQDKATQHPEKMEETENDDEGEDVPPTKKYIVPPAKGPIIDSKGPEPWNDDSLMAAALQYEAALPKVKAPFLVKEALWLANSLSFSDQLNPKGKRKKSGKVVYIKSKNNEQGTKF